MPTPAEHVETPIEPPWLTPGAARALLRILLDDAEKHESTDAQPPHARE
jgi:hypothetical protein